MGSRRYAEYFGLKESGDALFLAVFEYVEHGIEYASSKHESVGDAVLLFENKSVDIGKLLEKGKGR